MATYSKDFIIRYAEDELDAGERAQFEADLQNDPGLQAELSLYMELKATLQQRLAPDDTAAALRDTLAGLNKEYFKKETPVKKIPLTRWATGIAAAAVLVIATTLLWPSNNKNLLDRLGHTDMVNTTERGDNTDTLLQTAAVYFNHQEFAKAFPIIDSVAKRDTSSQLAIFYRGVTAWHLGKLTIARDDLQHVYQSGSVLHYEAAFYLALSYAKEKNNAAASEWLDKIPAGTPVSNKANELRTSLK